MVGPRPRVVMVDPRPRVLLTPPLPIMSLYILHSVAIIVPLTLVLRMELTIAVEAILNVAGDATPSWSSAVCSNPGCFHLCVTLMLGVLSLLLLFRRTSLWTMLVLFLLCLHRPLILAFLCFSVVSCISFVLNFKVAVSCSFTRRFGSFIASITGRSNAERCRHHFFLLQATYVLILVLFFYSTPVVSCSSVLITDILYVYNLWWHCRAGYYS
jgi:hypothetical protein